MTQTMTAEERVRALIDLTESLSDIVTRENDILATRRPRELATLQAEKARLASAYAGAIRDIARDRAAVAEAGGPLIEKLRELTKTFEGCALRQQALLEGATKAGEGLVRAVAGEAGRTSHSKAAIVLDERA
ncbi:MAG TPA: hypothetical protein DEA40_11545 [Parvularcula sp.]|nr:hypothetical protein [Parvularcula sp.]HBS34858.1 hypothetical protein [Parvularcula sp.]